jgi:hypothetical protein
VLTEDAGCAATVEDREARGECVWFASTALAGSTISAQTRTTIDTANALPKRGDADAIRAAPRWSVLRAF